MISFISYMFRHRAAILRDLDLYSFVLEDSLKMAPCAETCRRLILVKNCIFMICILLYYIECICWLGGLNVTTKV